MRIIAGRAPEVHVGEVVSNAVQLDAFHVEEVLPQGFGVLTESRGHGPEIADDGVSDAVVAEVDLLPLLQLIAEASRKGRADPDDEALLEKLQIVGDCGSAQTGFTRKVVVIDLLADSDGEELHEAHELLVLANACQCEQVLVQHAVAIGSKGCFGTIRIGMDLRKGAVDHQPPDVQADFSPAFVGGDFGNGRRPHLTADETSDGAFTDAAGQFKRGGSCGVDSPAELEMHVDVNKLLEDQADVGKALRFIDDDRVGLTESEFDVGRGVEPEQGVVGRVVAVESAHGL